MKRYPEYYEHIRGLVGQLGSEIPGTMTGFTQLHKEAVQPGALSTKCKELIALAIAVVVRCDGCISYHVHDALATGATRKEITEAIGVAVMMGGGPSLMYGAEALEALDQFAGKAAA
jgi:AhpD family alkylhydroperoxidase